MLCVPQTLNVAPAVTTVPTRPYLSAPALVDHCLSLSFCTKSGFIVKVNTEPAAWEMEFQMKMREELTSLPDSINQLTELIKFHSDN